MLFVAMEGLQDLVILGLSLVHAMGFHERGRALLWLRTLDVKETVRGCVWADRVHGVE